MPRRSSAHITPLAIMGIAVLMALTYYLFVTHWVESYFEGNAPDWFSGTLERLYPRLVIEKNRLPASFFLEKGNQVILRYFLVSLTVSLVLFYYQKNTSFKESVAKFFSGNVSPKSVKVIIIVYFAFMLLTTHEWLKDFELMNKAVVFYKPISFYQALPFPTTFWASVLIISMWLGAFCSIINIKTNYFGTISILLFILLQGYFYCFEKIDHGYVTYTYSGLGLLFLLHRPQKAWPIKLVQLTIVTCYVLAGLEKLFISHFQWLTSDTFAAYLSIHPTNAGQFIASSSFLCTLLPILVILLQLGFPLVFVRGLKLWVLLAGVLFHLSTVFIMDIGSYFHPWVVVYIFFIHDYSLRPEHKV